MSHIHLDSTWSWSGRRSSSFFNASLVPEWFSGLHVRRCGTSVVLLCFCRVSVHRTQAFKSPGVDLYQFLAGSLIVLQWFNGGSSVLLEWLFMVLSLFSRAFLLVLQNLLGAFALVLYWVFSGSLVVILDFLGGSSLVLQWFVSSSSVVLLWFFIGSSIVLCLFSASWLDLFSCLKCFCSFFYAFSMPPFTWGSSQKAKYLLWWVIISNALLHHSSIHNEKWLNLEMTWQWVEVQRPREDHVKENIYICSVTAGLIQASLQKKRKYSETQSNSSYLITHSK